MMKLFRILGVGFVLTTSVSAQAILLPIGSGPFAVELTPDATSAVVVNRNTNTISVVNLADNTTKATVTVGTFPTSVAINPMTNQAVVTNFGSDNVSVVDLASNTVTATIAVGPVDAANPNFRYSPRDVAIDPSQNIAIVANLNGNSVSLIDLNSNTVINQPIQLSTSAVGPISVTFYQEKNVALVANYAGNFLTVIDMVNRARLRDIAVGFKPVDVALNAKTKKAIVVNSDTNDITVLDLEKISDLTATPVEATITVGNRPLGAVINPNTNIAAVLSSGNKSITLVNLNDNTKFTTVTSSIGDAPSHMALNPTNNTVLVASPPNDAIYIAPLGFVNYLPLSLDTDAFRSNLGITNLGSTEANVQIELRDKDGNLLASGATKVPSQGLRQINNVNRFLLNSSTVSNTTAALRVTSDQPFSSFVSVIDNGTNDPGLQLGRTVGFPKLLINSATNTGVFRSRLVILNLGNTTAAVTLTARSNETGETLATKSDIFIPLNGFFISDDIFGDLGIVDNFGPLEISSPNLQPLIGVTLIGSSNRTSGFLEAVPIQ